MWNRSVLVWAVMALSPSFLWADSAPQVLVKGRAVQSNRRRSCRLMGRSMSSSRSGTKSA